MYEYPLTKFYFQVEWKGNYAGFQEVTGLEMTRDTADYRDGLDPSFIKKKVPGMKTFGELTLKRGTFKGDNDFFDWWNGATNEEGDGMPERRNLIITMFNAAKKPVLVWNVDKAFPSKLTATDLNASNNEIAIETLVLVHEGITSSIGND